LPPSSPQRRWARILRAGAPVSAPRRITKGATYLVTRRCTQRQFLLRPSRETNGIFLYCLCYAAAQTGIEIHGLVVMSNHWHGVVTDPEARLPEFLQILHRLVAAAMNAVLGRVENFWASEAPSVVQLDHPDDLLDKLAYVIANPVAAGLVKDPRDWPGVNTTGVGETLVAERPGVFFRESGQMPEHMRLVCKLPPALHHLGLELASRRLRLIAQESVRRARSVIRSQGRSFLGADGVRTMSIYRHATRPESIRKRRPSLASRDPNRRRAEIRQVRIFRALYRVAFDRWRAGYRATRFPDGTYQLRVVHAVSCGPPSVS
jgi:REP element-mobilizing transposase RayT